MIDELNKVIKDNSAEVKGWDADIHKLGISDSPALRDFNKIDSKDPAEVIEALAAL